MDNKTTLPKVSIITVCYNSENTIRKTIESIKNQTYNNIEYIVIDGNSNDGTIDICKEYLGVISVFISEPDLGIYNAMNKGVRAARGSLVTILNSDDYYRHDAIEKLVRAYLNNDKPDVVFGDIIVVGNNINGQDISGMLLKPIGIKQFPYDMRIYHPASIVKANLMKLYMFNEKYRIAADFDLFLRLKINGKRFVYNWSVKPLGL